MSHRILTGLRRGGGQKYLLRDDFLTTLADGAVNGTSCTPGPGTRTTIQIGGAAITIPSAGTLRFIGNNNSTDMVLIGSIDRIAGTLMVGKITLDNTDPAQTSRYAGFVNHYMRFATYVDIPVSVSPVLIANGEYQLSVILRTTGADYFFKGGSYATWRYMGRQDAGTITPQQTLFKQYHAIRYFDVNTTRVPDGTLWLPTPLISDGMSILASSDGLGHAETTGLGAGGGGVSWVDAVGTWQVAAGVRSAAALDGGIAICVVDAGKADVLHNAAITRSADNAGVIVRYVDVNNYVYAYILNDGANKATLRKVIAGSDSEVIAPTAITYGADKKLEIICDGIQFRLLYDKVAVGSQATISDVALQSGTKVGLYTSNVANTFNTIETYNRGVDGGYTLFDPFLVV